MSEPVRIGVIGAGWFASRRHLPDIERNPEAKLAALCRRDADALARLADRFAPEQTYTDWRAMLKERPLDAVLIATPHDQHFEQARVALEGGLHVLLEKPMTVHTADARKLRDLASERGLTLAVALNPPYWSHCHRMRDALRNGSIGEIEAIDMFWTGNAEYVFGEAPPPENLPGIVPPTMYRADPAQCGGGYLIDGGSHLISEVLWVSGLRPKRVTAIMDSTPSDRRTALVIALENGATATVTCVGDSAAGRRVQNTFAGSKGTIKVEGFDFATTLRSSDEVESFTEKDLPPVTGPVDNFIDAILGRAALHSSADHGAAVVEVVEAAYRSAESGQAVEV